jgi:RNA polymerase sigma-70 factor, ECF subfamily
LAEDGELIERTARGDRAAFASLVQRWRDPLFRYLRSIVPEESAEDALQETFLAVFRGAGGFRGDGSARAWLFGIARRMAARQRRRRAGEPARTEPLEALGVAAGWGATRDPEELASALEDRTRLQAALDALSDEDREVIVLADLEQLTGPEVAELLDLSVSAVKSRLHRARLRLMAELSQEACHVRTD